MLQWQRTQSRRTVKGLKGQKPLYTFEEIDGKTLRVTRQNEEDVFTTDFSIGHRFTTYDNLRVEMTGLNPAGYNQSKGYYISVRAVTTKGLGKTTDVSAQNQIDILYWGKGSENNFLSSSEVDVDNSGRFVEGAVKQVFVNRYERDPQARKICIENFGVRCQICKFDFSEMYGAYGEGFIEVHHIKPLHEIKKSYIVDPLKDLLPVCSNCHAILHRGKTPLSIEDLQTIITHARKNT